MQHQIPTYRLVEKLEKTSVTKNWCQIRPNPVCFALWKWLTMTLKLVCNTYSQISCAQIEFSPSFIFQPFFQLFLIFLYGCHINWRDLDGSRVLRIDTPSNKCNTIQAEIGNFSNSLHMNDIYVCVYGKIIRHFV